MSYIYVASKGATVELDGWNPFNHAYIVFVNDDGEEFVLRAGPDPTPAYYPFGDLTVATAKNNSNDYGSVKLEDTLDVRAENETAADRGAIVLDLGDRQPEDVWATMVNHAKQIDARELPYQATVQNSNSFVASVLYSVGITFGEVTPDPPEDYSYAHPASSNTLGTAFTNQSSVQVLQHYGVAGTDNADLLQGNSGNDTIVGGEGDDLIRVDTLESRYLENAAGFPVLLPEGSDIAVGGEGNDTIIGSGGNDILNGGIGNDLLIGGSLLPNSGHTVLNGDEGNDLLNGTGRVTVMNGGEGNDVYFGSNGINYITTGGGTDTILVGNGATIIEGEAGDQSRILIKTTIDGQGFLLQGGIGSSANGSFNYSWSNTDHIRSQEVVVEVIEDPDLGTIEITEVIRSGTIPFGGLNYTTAEFSEEAGISSPFEISYTLMRDLDPFQQLALYTYTISENLTYTPQATDLVISALSNGVPFNSDFSGQGSLTIIRNFENGMFGIELTEDEGFDTVEGGRNSAYYAKLDEISNNGQLVDILDVPIEYYGSNINFGGGQVALPQPVFNDELDEEVIKTVMLDEVENSVRNTSNSERFIGTTDSDTVRYNQEVTINLFNQSRNEGEARLDRYESIERFVLSNTGDDVFVGFGNNDIVNGRNGDDVLFGGGGDDRLIAGEGNDAVFGGDGNDVFVVGLGSNYIEGGQGIDKVTYRQAEIGVSINLSTDSSSLGDTINTIENVTGSDFDDTITGDAQDNRLAGLSGDDEFFGMSGSDVLVGGEGNDQLDGGLDSDRLIGGDGNDTFVFKEGYGRDVITDFDITRDSLKFEGFGELSLADLQDFAVQKSNGSTVINFGGDDRLILQNFDMDDLSSLDFALI